MSVVGVAIAVGVAGVGAIGVGAVVAVVIGVVARAGVCVADAVGVATALDVVIGDVGVMVVFVLRRRWSCCGRGGGKGLCRSCACCYG